MEELAVAAARAGRYPTLGVRGGYFHYGTKRFDSFQQEVAVGVDVNVPVFDGFRASSSIEAATKAAKAARLRYESMRNDKRRRVRELQRTVRTADREAELAARRASGAAERRKLADLSLRAQRGTLADALETRREGAHAARRAIDARWESVRLWAGLQREMGRLTTALTGGSSGAAAVP
jgi:outer membrane protein